MNSNPKSKRLLWLVLLGVCLSGGGFFANHMLQRRNDFYQTRAYQMDVMSDLQPVAADPWQDGTTDFRTSQAAPTSVSETQVDASSFLQAARDETTVAASSSLQAAVTQEFEAKQKLQEAQVQLLEQRVRELRRILEYRDANRNKIISNRIRELSGREAVGLGNLQPPAVPSSLQLSSPKIGNAVVQMPPRTGSLQANPTPYASNMNQPNQQVTLPELSSQPNGQTNALLGSLGWNGRPPEQANGLTSANRVNVQEPPAVANYDGTTSLVDDRAAFLDAISSPPQVTAPVREINFGPQNKFMRSVALGMFRGEKGVFLSADEETFVMQASPSQHERFAAVVNEIFTSPYVSPERLGAHIRDLEFKTKRMRTLLDSKDGMLPLAKEGRKKLEESLHRNEDLIAAFEAIINNHERSADVAEEVAVPRPAESASVFEEGPAEVGPISEQPDEVLELTTEPAVDYYEAPLEATSAEPVVETSDLPKEFSRGAETLPEEKTTEPSVADGFGLNTESR